MAGNRPEVLAPAGDFDSMRAAVAAGADANVSDVDVAKLATQAIRQSDAAIAPSRPAAPAAKL